MASRAARVAAARTGAPIAPTEPLHSAAGHGARAAESLGRKVAPAAQGAGNASAAGAGGAAGTAATTASAASVSWVTVAVAAAASAGVLAAAVTAAVVLTSAPVPAPSPAAASPAPSYPLVGTKATIWSRPTGVGNWTARSPGLPSDMGRNPFWVDDGEWAAWLGRRDDDTALLLRLLGGGPNASVVVYFPAYLADAAAWGAKPLQRLDSVLSGFAAASLRPILLLGRPDIGPSGTWVPQQDPVHVAADRAWLLARVRAVLALPSSQRHVRFVSVYWMGASVHCGGSPARCSEDDILGLNGAIEAAIGAAGTHFRHLVHADGFFQDACWPVPCGAWNDHGYSPRSLNGSWGFLLESWVQSSLVPAVKRLYAEGVFTPDRVLLMQDLRNCYKPGIRPCVTGSVASDARTWFRWLGELGLCGAGPTFATWRFEDSPASLNEFGEVYHNGSGLTPKGAINRDAALADGCG